MRKNTIIRITSLGLVLWLTGCTSSLATEFKLIGCGLDYTEFAYATPRVPSIPYMSWQGSDGNDIDEAIARFLCAADAVGATPDTINWEVFGSGAGTTSEYRGWRLGFLALGVPTVTVFKS